MLDSAATTPPFASALQVVDCEMTLRQIAVIEALVGAGKSMTVRGIAAGLGVSKPVITRALNSLQARGLIVRTKDATDRRSVDIVHTKEARVLYDALVGALAMDLAA